MKRHILPLFSGLLALLLPMYAPLTGATHPQLQAEAGNYRVFLGVIPAARIAEYPDLVPHGHPTKSGKNLYHVELAVYDKSTGQRVEDASVMVTSVAFGLSARRKAMQRMEMAGAITYCNYFRMLPGDHYTFNVDIRRAAWDAPLQLELAYGQVAH
ncbi:MAG TPA: hypothetical protein VIX81_04310 [Gammaproteobacteria bacterium]